MFCHRVLQFRQPCTRGQRLWHNRPVVIRSEPDPVLAQVFDQVVKVPPGAKVIGSNDFCENAALVYGDRIWTIQPHPEFGSDMINALATYRAPGVVPDPLVEDARAQLDMPTERHKVAQDMVAFLKQGGRADV